LVKPSRFGTIDGLRGIAAIGVALYHAERFSPIAVPSGFLAVDLFFVISGFVITRVYAPRFAGGMTLRGFALARLTRLYPLYLAGLSCGILVLALRPKLVGELSQWSALFAPLMLPTPGPLHADLFPLNVPAWTLFDELLINAAFALILRRLPTAAIALLATVCAAILLTNPSMTTQGSVIATAPAGFVRACYGFSVGMILARLEGVRKAQPARDTDFLRQRSVDAVELHAV
jgi:peptidoglycan/LPS O-acetylase OafA/YrhL